ncbi:hypothetical protein [Rhodovulum sp. YNF3179]|uniref:hypothetical protein n=1 Tax=Rhodovulum sp. YNF3179 TaxID=3425127 RepID=UPI003D356337
MNTAANEGSRGDIFDDNLLIHIGYAKAASSLLQSALFSGNHPEIEVIRDRSISQYHGTGENYYFKSGSWIFNDKMASGWSVCPFATEERDLKKFSSNNYSKKIGKKLAISNESWAGHPFSGGIQGSIIANRIHKSFPNARILIIIREQRKMILSTYSDYLVRYAGTARLEDFLIPRNPDQFSQHQIEYYCFSALVDWYKKSFGKDRVLVMPAENIFRNTNTALNEIFSFMGISKMDIENEKANLNTGRYDLYCVHRLFRRLNLLGKPLPGNAYAALGVPGLREVVRISLSKLLPRTVKNRILHKDLKFIEEQIQENVSKDNVRLQEMTDYHLESYGYLMPNS